MIRPASLWVISKIANNRFQLQRDARIRAWVECIAREVFLDFDKDPYEESIATIQSNQKNFQTMTEIGMMNKKALNEFRDRKGQTTMKFLPRNKKALQVVGQNVKSSTAKYAWLRSPRTSSY